ncbi:hypothetical protein METP3_03433 [Methanosarcinales archaeon]|nr:hypothetical protein METP3_03433 [Methanosarcinales archaeon]
MELSGKGNDIYYYKDKRECDFIIKTGEKIDSAIQVCYSLTRENRERELGGLLEAMEEFDLEEGLIITEDIEGEEKYNGKCVKFIPLWKWLFEIQDKA